MVMAAIQATSPAVGGLSGGRGAGSSSIWLMAQTGQFRFRLTPERQVFIGTCFSAAVAVCLATWWLGMRSGVRALEAMRK
jgi:hypothetical protein